MDKKTLIKSIKRIINEGVDEVEDGCHTDKHWIYMMDCYLRRLVEILENVEE